MPVTESVSSSKGFSDIYPSCNQFTHKLARLFDKCEIDQGETHHCTISFREATERIKTAVKNSLSDVENSTQKNVSEFRIGKTSVASQANQTFDPMKPMTWARAGGNIMKWKEHKKDNYDGAFEVGCVTKELIPKVIKETCTAIGMNHQMYALGMAQTLLHHYMVHEPDARLRNTSFDTRRWTEGKIDDKGAIIYVAYKLESGNIEEDGLVSKKEEQEGAASPHSLDDTASPPNADKDATATQKDETFEASTFGPKQGAIREKIPEQAHESGKRPEEKKIKRPHIDKKEEVLIQIVRELVVNDDWDKVMQIAYENRDQHLSMEMIKYYEDCYGAKLRSRIKSHVQRRKQAIGGKETNDNVDE